MVKITEMMGNENGSEGEGSVEEHALPQTGLQQGDLPQCPYGLQCYRKNPVHFRQFQHPHRNTQGALINLNEDIEVKIEIGHRGSSVENGHEWMMFVRGFAGNRIEHIVEKIVFHLPQSKQHTVTEPPYMAKQSGNDSFVLIVDLYLKDAGELEKVSFMYDLGSDKNSERTQTEKIIFTKPVLEFRQKLLRAGGAIMKEPDVSSASTMPGPSNKRKRPYESVSSSSQPDEFESFGVHCASKLKAINDICPTQKIIAEKLVSEVFYHAQMKLLQNSSFINLPPNNPRRPYENVSVSSQPNEFDSFGVHCTSKLKTINDICTTQKIIAEKLISEIFYNAQMKSLQKSSFVNLAGDGSSAVKREVIEKVEVKEETLADD